LKVHDLDAFDRLCATVEKHTITLDLLKQENCSLIAKLEKLEFQTGLALGRNRNVVIHGLQEPYMIETRKRKHLLYHDVVNLLRLANVPSHSAIKRLLRVGKWRGSKEDSNHLPRPIVVEFANPRNRDRFLTAAGHVRNATHGNITITPDDKSTYQRNGPLNSGLGNHQVTKTSDLEGVTMKELAIEPQMMIDRKDCSGNLIGSLTTRPYSEVVENGAQTSSIRVTRSKSAPSKNGRSPRI
jgi:hypothetical protein